MRNDWCANCHNPVPRPCVELAGVPICVECITDAADDLGIPAKWVEQLDVPMEPLPAKP